MRAVLALLATLPAPLVADSWACTFTASCQTGRACLATDWAAELDTDDAVILRSDRGETALTALGDNRYAAPGMLLSIRPGGVATLTTHGPPVESHLGDCTVLR